MSRINVIHPDESTQPFMRGILTNELMRRGMSFQKAFMIAEDAKSHFDGEKENSHRAELGLSYIIHVEAPPNFGVGGLLFS